jgi:hypothetical protein
MMCYVLAPMRAHRWTARVLLFAGFLGVWGPIAERTARAATADEKAGARAAASQGEDAFNAKHWAEAVDLFTRAESLVHSPLHLLFRARALVQLGQLVAARETYQDITHDQSSSSTLAKAQEAARLELSALEPRLANLDVKVDGPGAASATVTMDGAAVPRALVGLSHPVDPGEHKFRASGNGVQSDVVTFAVKEGGSGTVTLLLKPTATGVPAAASVASVASAPAAPAAPLTSAAPVTAAPVVSTVPATGTSAPDPNGGGSGLRAGSYVAFGVAAVGLVAGTVFALSAKSKYKDGNALCSSDPCNLTSAQADQRTQFGKDGDSAKTLSLVGFIVGGVGVVTGTTLLLLSGHQASESHASIEPWIGPGSLGLNGKF